MDAIAALIPDSHATPALPLREMHDAYLGGDGRTMEPAMALALSANFGSVERWREAFAALGKGHGGGAGWALLAFQPREGTLVNRWVADQTRSSAGGVPILALAVHGRADHHDFGASPGPRVTAFLDGVDWAKVYERYQAAVHDASEPFGADPGSLAGALVLDVRRAAVYEQASGVIPGARWRDPARVAEWSADLPAGREVIVYCVYGHEVGRATTLRLRAAGLKARFLRGGIDGWRAAGQPLAAKEGGAS
jgi:Fe-Mn family superoxide dismutase